MAHDGAADEATTAPLLASSEKPRRNMYAFGCATLASMTTILMGYNLALMSGAQLFIREDLGLSDEQVEVLAGSMNVYMLVSILAAGWTADLLGRRGTLVLANGFLMAGALAMSLGGSYAALMAARFVTSIGVGFALVVAPVYNAEISPASVRGVLSSLLDVLILLSYVSNYALAGLPLHVGWRVMYAIGVLPPVFLAAGVLAMPESPRWLAMRGHQADARAVLVRTSDTAAEAELQLEEIKRVVEAPQEAGAGVWRELVFQPSAMVRRILVCVVGLNFLQQAAGIDAILLYSPLVFKKAGMSRHPGRHHRHRRGEDVLHPRGLLLLRPSRPAPAPDGQQRRRGRLPGRPGPHALRRRDLSRDRGRVRGVRAGLRRGLLGGVRVAPVHVQRGDHAAAAAHAGRQPGHGGEPADVRGGEHVLHLALCLDHDARVLLPVRRLGRHGVRLRLRAPAGDQGPEPRGHGRAFFKMIVCVCDLLWIPATVQCKCL